MTASSSTPARSGGDLGAAAVPTGASAAKKMNVVQLTFIVAVNMMGSGIIMLPTNMAQVGAISLLSWIVTALGSMAIAYGFALAIERPGIRIGRRWSDAILRRKEAAPAAAAEPVAVPRPALESRL